MVRYPVLPIRIFGDATGSARTTSASRTDWQIVRDFMGGHPYPVDPDRSHVSDALGYMIADTFGMRPRSGEMPGLMQ